MQTNDPLLVSIPAAAQMLGVGRTTVYRLISSGEIDARKIGACTRITTESLRRFAGGRAE